MKKLNNQGFTLTELLITVGLLSLIILMSFYIINDLLYLKKNVPLAYENQITRATIIDTIQQDILANGLIYDEDLTEIFQAEKTDTTYSIYLKSRKGTAKLTLTTNSLTYLDFNGKENTWNYVNAYSTIDISFNFDDDFKFLKDTNGSYALITIRIPIYTKNSNNNEMKNNINDDIILTYFGKYNHRDALIKG